MPESSYDAGRHYKFGNGTAMDVRGLVWNEAQQKADSQSIHLPIYGDRYTHAGKIEPGSPEWQSACDEKLAEIRDNWQIVVDPEEDGERTVEATVVNADALENEDASVMVRISDSTIPDDPAEALRLADDALANPNRMIIHIARPGRGGSTGLSDDELKKARKDGRLVRLDTRWEPEKDGLVIESFDSYPSIKTMARVIDQLKGTRGKVSHLYADGIGAHYASALMSDLPPGDLERVFFSDPTNMSDIYGSLANWLQQIPGHRRGEGFSQSYKSRLSAEMDEEEQYAQASTDPLAITPERIENAERILDADFEKKVAEERNAAKSSKMRREQQIYNRGLDKGKAAVYHLVAGLIQHPDAKVSYGISELAAQYESRAEISRFMELAFKVGRKAVGSLDVECYELPVNGRWHLYHPMARMALMDRAFYR